jgi:hypothetical protein
MQGDARQDVLAYAVLACFWLLVVLVVVAVAHRRLGPSSSATTSTVDRALPSSAVQLRCWSRPTTTIRLPLDSDCAACSASSRHTMTVKNDASWSRRPLTATRNMARVGEGPGGPPNHVVGPFGDTGRFTCGCGAFPVG